VKLSWAYSALAAVQVLRRQLARVSPLGKMLQVLLILMRHELFLSFFCIKTDNNTYLNPSCARDDVKYFHKHSCIYQPREKGRALPFTEAP
jgi:hypothetical protein